MKNFEIKGLKTDTKAIARGMVEMIKEFDQEHILALGMIPLWVKTLLEKEVKDKISQIVEEQQGMKIEEIEEIFNVRAEIDRIVNGIVNKISIEIYSVAGEQKLLVV